MENEGNLYEIADQYGYTFNDRVSPGGYHTQLGMVQRELERNYMEWDIEATSLGTIRALETAATIDLQSYDLRSFADRVGYVSPKIKLDCSLDDILENQKRGLKPYYQEKLEYEIEGSNDGAYIEYEPGTDLSPTQKIEWLSPKLIEKINSCYESKKQTYKDKKEADEKYLITLAEIDQAIENYKTKGHNFIL